jgi:hypothetical protein
MITCEQVAIRMSSCTEMTGVGFTFGETNLRMDSFPGAITFYLPLMPVFQTVLV